MHRKKVQSSSLELATVTKGRLSLREKKAEPPGKLVGKRSSQQLAELSDKTKRPKLQARKEKFDYPCRCSKRLTGPQLEPVYNPTSTVLTRQVVSTKSSNRYVRQDPGLASAGLENRASQHLGFALEKNVAGCTLTEVNSTLQGVPLSKDKGPLEGPLLPVDILDRNEGTLQVAFGESNRGDASLDEDIGLQHIINIASLPLWDSDDESEDFLNTLEDIDFTSSGEPLNKGDTWLQDQVRPEEQHHETEEMDADMVSFLFREEPCFEVAVKVITGKLSIEAWTNRSYSRNANASTSKAIQAGDSAHEASIEANDSCTIINSSVHEEPQNKIEKAAENQAAAEEKFQMLETEEAPVEHPLSVFSFPLPDTCSESDLFFDYAFQSAKEDDMFHSYFQRHLDTTDNQIDRLPLPDFGSPSIFQSHVTPQFNTAGEYVPYFPVDLFPMDPSLPPAGNVSQPLSINSSSEHAGNEGFSNGRVGSDQLISMNPSSLPAGHVASSSSCGVGTQKPCSKRKIASESAE